MCAVNDAKRAEYNAKITSLEAEKTNEENKLKDIERAKGELVQLVDKADCAINNIAECDFGGNNILNSVTLSKNGYNDRINYYDEYALKVTEAVNTIENEIAANVAARDALPENCGSCSECRPPEKTFKV